MRTLMLPRSDVETQCRVSPLATGCTAGKRTPAESSGESKRSPSWLMVTDQKGSFPNARYTAGAVLAVDESRADAASVFFALSPLLQAASRVNAMTAHI